MKTTREYTPGATATTKRSRMSTMLISGRSAARSLPTRRLPGYSDARYLVCNNDDTMTQEQIDELKKSMTESEKRTDVEKANLSNLFDKFIEVGGVFGMSGSVTVFGQTYEGLDVVEKLCNIQSDENTYRAVDKVLVKSVTISEYHADGESSGTAEQ